jgi:cytochrome b/b6/petD-like protein
MADLPQPPVDKTARPGPAPPAAPALPDKLHSWPYFVRAEFIAGSVLILVLLVWSLVIDAPLEAPANPTKTPNPSKAPWYFLGLQEILVYFDPWIAGVVLPSIIIVGLMAIPYVDINPKGNGYYTWRERKFAISVFLFGFLGLWLGMIFIGVFLRGPGWNLFMPWEYWDPHLVVPLTNVDLPYLLGIRSAPWAMVFGLACLGGWLVGIPLAVWRWKRRAPFLRELGAVRYALVASLFMMMAGVVVKMGLRLLFNVKYVLVIPNILNV